jgi:hypothetical protein
MVKAEALHCSKMIGPEKKWKSSDASLPENNPNGKSR